jgi:hypothetical protein
LQRAPLILGHCAGDCQLTLRPAQLEVGARELGRQRDPDVTQIFLGRRDQCGLA